MPIPHASDRFADDNVDIDRSCVVAEIRPSAAADEVRRLAREGLLAEEAADVGSADVTREE